MNQPLETQGRPGRLEQKPFTSKNRYAGAFLGFPLFFDTPQSSGEQVQEKKGSNVLDKGVNHKLSRETQFRGDLVSAAPGQAEFMKSSEAGVPEECLSHGLGNQMFKAKQ